VQTKKRKMKMGEAFVGMKRRGSQLQGRLARVSRTVLEEEDTFLSRTSRRFFTRSQRTLFQLMLSSSKG